MARKKQAAKKGRGARKRAKSTASTAEMAPMALELYSAVGAVLKHYGFTGLEIKQAFEGSQRLKSVPPASTQWGNQLRPVGNLMAAWTEELPYVDDSGRPRALDVKGRGATFESLAKRFFPGRPVAEVVELVGRFGSVGVLAGGKIALYGDALVNVTMMPQSSLAHIIRHIKQMVGTCLYNAKHARPGPIGRIERIVTGFVSPEEFDKFNTMVRPQVHDLCDHVDKLLNSSTDRARRPRPKSEAAGIGVYVYYNGNVKRTRSEARDKPGE
jgi:hypothetical protein